MPFRVDRDSGVPLGAQLADGLRTQIDTGELAAGDRLPSLRDLAGEAGVNVNTVRAVYAKLETAGIVKTEQGRGTFVTTPTTGGDESRRRELRDDIARLEAQLVRLPQVQPAGQLQADRRGGVPRLLSVAELAAVRDLLAEQVADRQRARSGLVERARSQAVPPTAVQRSVRMPSRRSSSSLAGARVRWTGA